MKIKGFYILTRRSVIRILAILGIAVGSLYAETTAESKVFSSRVEDVQAELISLKKRLPEDSSRAQLPDVQYLEYKSVYLEAKRYNKEHGNPEKTARRDASPHHAANPEPRPPTVGFMVELRKKINEIHDASVLGKPPPDKRLRGLIRQKQVLYGVDQYKPHEVSFEKAARMAITAFKGERGAYSEREWKSLKQAIRRHVLDDRKKFAT